MNEDCSRNESCTRTKYTYDAEDRRVRRAVPGSGITDDYVYDLDGHAITQMSSTGWWIRGEIYAGGRHIATYENDLQTPTTFFTHADWLGTERVQTAVNGTTCETVTSLPFGDGMNTSGSCDPTALRFTGKERDWESNLDYFGARYNSSALGRFTRPDPIMISKPKIADPQQWNMYAYARNNPLRFIDPTGMYVCQGSTDQCKAIQTALANVQSAANNLKAGSKEQKTLEKILKFYGPEGKKNGVTVKFGSLGGQEEAHTGTTSFLGLFKRTTITFDLNQIQKDFSNRNENAEAAGISAHEGQHGLDQRLFGMAKNRAQENATEINAFGAQSFVSQGLGVNSAYGLWNTSWPASNAEALRQQAIESNAQKATDLWCSLGGNCQ